MSRARTAIPYHHGDLPAAIAREALALVAEQGLAGLTLREVARRIGVSHAAPYRHFRDRTALVTALAIDGLERLATNLELALEGAGTDPRARFVAAGWAYVLFALDEPARFAIIFTPSSSLHDPRVRAVRDRSFGILLRYIDDAQRAGFLAEGAPLAIATPIWAMQHGLATLAAAGGFKHVTGREALHAVVEAAHDALLEGITRVPSPVTPGATRRRSRSGPGRSAR